MKKAIILLLCAALTLGLAACGEAAVEDSAAPSADVSAEPAPVESAAPGESAPRRPRTGRPAFWTRRKSTRASLLRTSSPPSASR